jgi:uncharacterized protein YoxC
MEIKTFILIAIALLLVISIFLYYREDSKCQQNFKKLSVLYDELKNDYDELLKQNQDLLKLLK